MKMLRELTPEFIPTFALCNTANNDLACLDRFPDITVPRWDLYRSFVLTTSLRNSPARST